MADTTKGIAEIVAGTGGEDLRGFNAIIANCLYRIEGRVGGAAADARRQGIAIGVHRDRRQSLGSDRRKVSLATSTPGTTGTRRG